MKEKIAGLSVFVNLLLAIGKIIVGFLAGATSVFAEGIHSGMDVISSGVSLIGIKISKKPVDKKHPYGHYKFEVLSGLIITIILFLTGAFIVFDSFREFQNPSPIKVGYLVLGVMLISAIINEIMARVKIHYGKKENSISLLSDGVHSRVDVWTSIAVLIGLFLTKYWIYADSLLAFLIGLYIIKESFSLGKEATDSLLDVSAGEEIELQIKKIAKQNNIEISDLKTQKKGSAITTNMEIKLPEKLSVKKATEISKSLKEKLIKEIESLEYVAIQIKSHEITDTFFKPTFGFGKGFGWQREGKFKKTIKEAQGKGPEGNCVCEKCGYEIKHERGVPCSTIKCPKCKINLIRK
ncbi:MAG: cation diffusion facilitator family transporter [Nanoarchaeota archaeon]|nr:cation diffusion facilitator family transporter [Nanoarchaeota archaeon]